jgi:hypothetical protein
MPRYLFLDIHCAPCHRADGGDPDRLRFAPRLARFSRHPDGGPINLEPFKGKGPWRPPHPPPFGHQPGGRAFPAKSFLGVHAAWLSSSLRTGC